MTLFERRIPLDKVVVTPKNIIDLKEYLYEKYEKSRDRDKEIGIVFYTNDEKRYTYREEEVKNEEKKISENLQSQRVLTIQMGVQNDKLAISMQLTQVVHNNPFINFIILSSEDEQLTSAEYTIIQDKIKSWKKTESSNKYKSLFSLIFGFGLALLISPWLQPPNPLVNFLTVLSMVSIFSYLILENYIDKYFPRLEIASGPKHLQSEAIRRKQIWKFTTILIIPFILDLLHYLFKFF